METVDVVVLSVGVTEYRKAVEHGCTGNVIPLSGRRRSRRGENVSLQTCRGICEGSDYVCVCVLLLFLRGLCGTETVITRVVVRQYEMRGGRLLGTRRQ